MTGFGELLFELRERANKTQDELAASLRWPQSKLSRLETGTRVPKADDLEALLTVLGATEADRLRALATFRPRQR